MVNALKDYSKYFKSNSVHAPGSLSWVYPENLSALEFGYTSEDGINVDAIFIDGFPNGIDVDVSYILDSIMKGNIRYEKQGKFLVKYTICYGKDMESVMKCQSRPVPSRVGVRFGAFYPQAEKVG